MAAMMVRGALERAMAYFRQQTQLRTAAPALALGPLAVSGGAAAVPASNPLSDALWLAAPKSKVTPSRKKIRNNHLTKRLKNIVHFQDCPMCGDKKLRHRLCMSCFKKGKYFV